MKEESSRGPPDLLSTEALQVSSSIITSLDS
jgi:hypothetical protein